MVQQLIEDFPDQLRRAIKVGEKIKFVPTQKEIRNIVISALGGSGIGAGLVETLVFDEIKVPITIIKSYDIPACVTEHTLFIASSFSGNTEETLAAIEKVFDRRATIACITAGGKLLEMADTYNFTLAHMPSEAPSPRSFLGYNFVQLLFILKNYGLISSTFVDQLNAAANLLEERQERIKEGAQNMAAGLHGKLPVLYGDARFMPVLVRFQQQINENSKQLAHVNVYPEMNHNELSGWQHPGSILRDMMVVMLTTRYDHPRVKTRMEITRPMIVPKSGGVIEVVLQYGESLLEQCLYAIHLFDWTSWYLSVENKADTNDSKVVDHLKNELSKV